MTTINPKHYTTHSSGVEAIHLTRLLDFCLGNCVKYVWRYSTTNRKDDLLKALRYTEFAMELHTVKTRGARRGSGAVLALPQVIPAAADALRGYISQVLQTEPQDNPSLLGVVLLLLDKALESYVLGYLTWDGAHREATRAIQPKLTDYCSALPVAR